MIVDGKGNLFENRRKANSDRRKYKIDVADDRRKKERRTTDSGEGRVSKRK